MINLAPDMVVVGEADSVIGTLRGLSIDKPDVVIVDVALTDGGVVEVARSGRGVHPLARWLVLGRSSTDEARRIAEEARAEGFLLDAARGAVLRDVIRRVAAAERPAAAAPPGRPEPRSAEDCGLTLREREVLALIANGLTNRQIGGRLGLAEKTVKNYVSALLAKLQVERRTQAAIYEIARQSDVKARADLPGHWAAPDHAT